MTTSNLKGLKELLNKLLASENLFDTMSKRVQSLAMRHNNNISSLYKAGNRMKKKLRFAATSFGKKPSQWGK